MHRTFWSEHLKHTEDLGVVGVSQNGCEGTNWIHLAQDKVK